MNQIDPGEIDEYVESRISDFHAKRVSSLDSLSLKQVLRRKNPYLFKTKNLLTPEQIVKELVDAHISSHEETVFGEWLEELAVLVCKRAFSGRKSGIPGIDLELEKEKTRYLVSVKSGPNWGNSGQIKQMLRNFTNAKKTLNTSGSKLHVVCINGCCYGQDAKPHKGDYLKLCGQKFWEFISGRESFYLDIVEALGHKAKERNQEFVEAYTKRLNKFASEFMDEYCDQSDSIDWEKLVRFNSSAKK